MRRFDRAVCAMFLLVLLAEVARAHASVPVAGEAAGNLILTAAQLRAGSGGGAVLAMRRADGSLAPIARWKRAGLALPEWSRMLAGRRSAAHLSNASHLVLLSGITLPQRSGSGVPVSAPLSSASSSLAVFAHTASPAP